MSKACRTTSVNPLSCRDDKSDGSWNTYTVTTSVAETQSPVLCNRDKVSVHTSIPHKLSISRNDGQTHWLLQNLLYTIRFNPLLRLPSFSFLKPQAFKNLCHKNDWLFLPEGHVFQTGTTVLRYKKLNNILFNPTNKLHTSHNCAV